MKKWFLIWLTCMMVLSGWMNAAVGANQSAQGIVFWDKNGNGRLDQGEPGIPNVCVSNGKEVVQTDAKGRYSLPAYDEMVVFVTKPADFDYPLNENNLPQFSYVHQPQGSPSAIKQYQGLEPTGNLPEKINFPLLKAKCTPDFKAIITGDTQVYNEREIGYLRDTFVKEAAAAEETFVLTMGDNVGDRLSLYPRLLSVLKAIHKPIYLTPGNHDLNLDSPDYAHSLDTFKREFGPTYYSFNYGQVHFVVLNSVYYPSPIYSQPDRKTYHGEIDPTQMEWLRNDLSFVPDDHLIVVSMHIPLVSYIDRLHEQHHVQNRTGLYSLLSRRKAVVLAGHTHTTEQFLPGEIEEGWGQPIGVRQLIIGAACGSWWSGDTDEYGVPFSFQKCGSPKNYMIFDFEGANYQEYFKAIGKRESTQMNLSFWTRSFNDWCTQLLNWYNADPQTRPSVPPVNQSDLPDLAVIKIAELPEAKLVANIWDGNSKFNVWCRFDQEPPVQAVREKNCGDPAALRDQLSVTRYAIGFTIYKSTVQPTTPQPLPGLFATSSTHIWTCPVPANLKPGLHTVKIRAEDPLSHRSYTDMKIFEVVEE